MEERKEKRDTHYYLQVAAEIAGVDPRKRKTHPCGSSSSSSSGGIRSRSSSGSSGSCSSSRDQ